MSKLNATAVAQDRRYYYKPGGRSQAPGSKVIKPRTKVSLSQPHLLQRLVYVESDPYERQEEQRPNAVIAEESLIKRHIKHLINIALMRNSFHVTLGVSRLLYNYTTAESIEIYDLIMQDPDRAKDDAYWRERKARLMRELKERFGQSLAIVRGPHGEERFQTREDSARYLELVKQCLQMFTPWDTPCPLPGEGPAPGKIEALTFRGSDPDEEHQIEVARMHAVIHPDCHERLVAGLGLESPTRRLEIPKFFHTSGRGPGDGPQGDREDAEEPTESELDRMRREIDDQSARRKRPPPSRLRVLVDGAERAGLALDRKSEARFEVEEGSKLIEVRTAREEGGLLLAVHVLCYDDAAPTAGPSRFSTELNGGQKIFFTISPLRQLHEEGGASVFGVSVVVSYGEAHPLHALQRAWRRLAPYLLRVWRPQRWAEERVRRYSLAIILIAVGALSAVWLLIVRERTSRQTQVARHKEPVTVASPVPSSPPPSATISPHIHDPRMAPSPPSTSGPALKTTRGVLRREAGSASASLIEVKKICVELTGDRQVDPAIIDHLNRSLQASQRWTTVTSDKADALLSLVGGADEREVSVRLVNQEGKTLWPRAGRDRGREYGVTAEEAARVVADLLADVRELERRRRVH
ncbi:MAG TPA: hypothetical protein VE715_03715 [Blastocatellia bacterium]|nr:hypothetical protein [Blastocatellia bacterium]